MTRLSRFFTRHGLRRDPMNRTIRDALRDAAPGCGRQWRSNNGIVTCTHHAGDRHYWIGEGEFPPSSFVVGATLLLPEGTP